MSEYPISSAIMMIILGRPGAFWLEFSGPEHMVRIILDRQTKESRKILIKSDMAAN